jgi:dephospho-CoA kinase
MIIIGLTGSIGMGKSTVARQFLSLGVHICNADAIAHQLMSKGGAAVADIEGQFPGVVKNGSVDRKKLGDIVFADKAKLTILEAILHPLVVEKETHFLEAQRLKGADMAVLEIPLLFETHAQERCDMVLVASASPHIQKQRVMRRAGMTEEKFKHIIALQMPDREKCSLADVVIETGLGKAHSFRQVAQLIKNIRNAA